MRRLLATLTMLAALAAPAASAHPFLSIHRARLEIAAVETEEDGVSSPAEIEWHLAGCQRHSRTVIDCRIYERGLVEAEDGSLPLFYCTDRATLRRGRVTISFVNRP